MQRIRVFFLMSIGYFGALMASGGQLNPPVWPSSVTIFDPTMSAADINAAVNAVYQTNGGLSCSGSPPVSCQPGQCDNGQFTGVGHLFLFQPGVYANVTVPVGYYTSVAGLGQSPVDTQIQNVYCEGGCPQFFIAGLNSFWRSAENFATSPNRVVTPQGSTGSGYMQWVTSQACPLRRIQMPAPNIPGSSLGIQLWSYILFPPSPCSPQQAGGEVSGGFMADCVISAPSVVSSGGQQQFFARNCTMNWSDPGVWNMVFVGCNGMIPSQTTGSGYFPPGQASNAVLPIPNSGYFPSGASSGLFLSQTAAITNIPKTPVIAEKPYITYSGGKYFLQIPNLEKPKTGPTQNFNNTTSVDFTSVFVANPATVTAAQINMQIAQGNHIVLPPAIYTLEDSIRVTVPNICILGFSGTIIVAPSNGQPCIVVQDDPSSGVALPNVRIAGVLMQAGTSSSTLLQWGQSNTGSATAPGLLHDVFARVGGPANPFTDPVSTKTMVTINNSQVIIDNCWLWRADHWSTMNCTTDNLVVAGQNPCINGLIVNGDDVTIYGLSVEHTLGDLVQWPGNNGTLFFYQAELPYDVMVDYGTQFVAYRAQPKMPNPSYTHTAYGLGVYCFFRDNPVNLTRAIATPIPVPPGVTFTNVLTKFLADPRSQGGIVSVINSTGLIVNGNSGPSRDSISVVAEYSASTAGQATRPRHRAP